MVTRTVTTELEERRRFLQDHLDAQKSAAERNRMGQFYTPNSLAVDILRYAESQLGEEEDVRFIDPAIGTGAFYSALLKVFDEKRVNASVGYEIDPHYGLPAAELSSEMGLDVRLQDFTQDTTPGYDERFILLICNPPYVRHHHILNDAKRRLHLQTRRVAGIEINGLAGLYCYFLGLSHGWMTDGGLAGWLIPSEFMDVNYGISLKRYLLDHVTLLHIHRFDPKDVQFGDALVSSAVVWFRKEAPPINHEVRFSYGGTLRQPKQQRLVPAEMLRHAPKWTRYPMNHSHKAAKGPVLGDFFTIKRGIATGNNKYFIISADEIKRRQLPMEAFKPILPSPRYLTNDEIKVDRNGTPYSNVSCSCSIRRGRKMKYAKSIRSYGTTCRKVGSRALTNGMSAATERCGMPRKTVRLPPMSAPILGEVIPKRPSVSVYLE